ncbi:hypothetical protein E3E36_09580 [Thermococcus sp. M36]|uniref:hypothetical protein n=1 Tax=Thermococcus sp. M36 TaxID=1638261 RepID=UPI00143C0165|nr:hypothetical protein [Thermococcus sp. M36]NJE06389.1 hypothetical protein [Thermococcus sp. M36]
MGALETEIGRTLINKKFLGALLIAVLLTYGLPFPFIKGFLGDYGKIKEIRKQMEKENEAIVCHRVYDTDPEFFSSHGMKCNDEYYRPNGTTVGCCGMSVYRDTYWQYLRVKGDLRKELPKFLLFVVWAFLSLLTFSYALINIAAGLSEGREVSIRKSILSGFRALPALVASEFIMLLALLIALILLAIPIAVLGPAGGLLVGVLAGPAFALVIPAYYFTHKIGGVGEVWKIFKNNPTSYIVLGILLGTLDTIMAFQYEHYLGIGTLMIMLTVGALRYVVSSIGALEVYLEGGGATGEEEEEKWRIEWEV